jgi:DNA recombination protein RmuC
METILVILLSVILLVLLILIGAIVWLVVRSTRPALQDNEQIANLAGKLDAIQKQVDSSLQSFTNQVSVFGEVKESLGKVTEATNRVMELGDDINKLHNILQSPLRRGGFGEIMLENLLSQVLPDKYFQIQYSFQNNTRVDAVLKLGQHILPVDSKFPLQGFDGEASENHKTKSAFVRIVKDRIDETSKYILPTEGTFEFVMMYIPAENVYYEIISNSELFNYAMQKRVIAVSPNSFFAYLQVVVFGLRGLQIEENAREILERISSLKLALNGVQDRYDKLGTNITNAQSKYSELGKKLGKFSNQFDQLAAETLPREASLQSL